MNLLRWITIVLTVCVGIVLATQIQSTLSEVYSDQRDIVFIWLCFLMFWFNMEFGLWALGNWLADRRSKRIQKELDIERSFRKLGGDV